MRMCPQFSIVSGIRATPERILDGRNGQDSPTRQNGQSASRTASWKAGLTSRINWLCRSGQVRLVSNTTATLASKSIQSEQPLYPRCPIERCEKYLPDEELEEGVSQPSARELPSGLWRCAKRPTVAGSKRQGLRVPDAVSDPASRISPAKRSRSGTLEKSPAWPPAPWSSQACSDRKSTRLN